jgi:hypothetical protein
LHEDLQSAGGVDDILALVSKRGDRFTSFHTAVAIGRLLKLAKSGEDERAWRLEGERLSRDPRFARLIDSVRTHCPSFRASDGAKVLQALGVLQADLGALSVDEVLAAQLAGFVEREARAMKPQAVGVSLNALGKTEAAAAAVSPSGWTGLAQAVDRTACEIDPQSLAHLLSGVAKLEVAAAAVTPSGWAGLGEAVGNSVSLMTPHVVASTLISLCKLEAVAVAVTPSGWAGLAEAVGRGAHWINNLPDYSPDLMTWRAGQTVAGTLESLCKLEAAAAAVTPSGWAHLGGAVEKTARAMTPQAVARTLNALCTLEAAAVAVTPLGWAALAEAVERTANEMNPQEVSNTLYTLGVLPAAAAELSPSAWTYLEAAAEREAPSMTSYEREATLRGCEKLKLRIPSALSE